MKTTERGLGAEHQQQRRVLLPLAYGTACPLCGLPMLKGQPLDLDHVVPRVMGGSGGPVRIAHARCNRRLGSKLGNHIRAARTRMVRRAEPRW